MLLYVPPKIKKITNIEQLVRLVPSIKDELAARNHQMARAVCSMLGHEINNPLTVVAGFVEILQSEKEMSPKFEKYLPHIADGTRKASDAVKRIMQIKRIVLNQDGMLNLEWSTKRYSKPRTATIVEDDESLRNTMEDILISEGFDARAFRDPEKAREHFLLAPYSILVTDINLKARKTGFDLLKDLYEICKDFNYLMPAAIVASASLGKLKDRYSESTEKSNYDLLHELASAHSFFCIGMQKPIHLDELRRLIKLAEHYQNDLRTSDTVTNCP
ncbi:hypothetical protein KY325_01105 [Candidatus Woesearchaeota archaeon]|nr:hypothetical protein [Candidatus Woesearchaeota archaeon]MBW3017737.1 hypothetical protein [Candidatus Woesearchaeota archaeon]